MKRYTRRVSDAIIAVVGQAQSRLKPARVGYGTTKVDLNVKISISSDLVHGAEFSDDWQILLVGREDIVKLTRLCRSADGVSC